ncbi:hypothetical protein N7G274_007605 [Stereocaulon virgatum]|uniref:Man(5)GlcNAc(2)-PP-dolichol translocation protein RFT1 n=1 Tax=Stereocaulon virgatum TaxID=373712 RepID=A0ABR4A359_9LECA
MARVTADSEQIDHAEPPHKRPVSSESALSAAFLVLNQIGTRALTFAVNQLLLRYLSPKTYGVATQLELFSVSILYFSRESLRVALQRQHGDDDSEKAEHVGGRGPENDHRRSALGHGTTRRIQEVVNISHIAFGLGVPLTAFFAWLYLRSANSVVLATAHLHSSLYIYALATLLELLIEPAFAVAKQQMLDGTRVWAEFRASLTKCLVTCATAIWASRTGRDVGVLPFAMGQLSYAVVLNLVYVWNIVPICTRNGASLLSKTINPNNMYFLSRFSRPLITIAATFYGQAIFNQILTSGDSYLIAALATLPAQGAYALASNYGGLLARMLFQPIEEASRSLFGRLPTKDSPPTKSTNRIVQQAVAHLTNTLHFYSLLSLFAISLGPPLSPPLLRTLAGARWTVTEAPAVLAAYCYLIPLLAINGILEAFVSAVATPAQIRAQSSWKMAQLCAFAGTSFIALKIAYMDAPGLVVANAVTMISRIAWSWGFVQRYLGATAGGGGVMGLKVSEMVPSVWSLAVGAAARGCLSFTLDHGADVGVGELVQSAVTVAAYVVGVMFFERHFLISMIPEAAVDRLPILQYVTGTRKDADEKKSATDL